MHLFHRLAAVSLIWGLASVAAKADEPPVVPLTLPADSAKIVSGDLAGAPSSKAAFANATPAVRLAMCGIEAESGNAGLDAGLIDFKTPDPHAAGRSSEDSPQAGRNVPDYRSSVFLGITLGYHF